MHETARQLGRSFQFDNIFTDGELLELTNFRIRQIGELCCEGGYQIDPHIQVCDEISIVLSGSGTFFCAEQEYTVKKGDIIINPIGTYHKICANEMHSLRFFYLGFNFRTKPTEEPYLTIENLFRTAKQHKATAPSDINVYLLAVLNEFYNKKLGFTAMANAYIEQIILMTCRAFLDPPSKKYLPNLSNRENAAYSVIRYIDQNALTITNIKAVAAELGYSYTYLSHMFRKKTGVTLQEYIAFRRMEWAKQMLSEQGMSIVQVSETLRYETPQSFARAFRRIIGQSPSEFIKTTKENA